MSSTACNCARRSFRPIGKWCERFLIESMGSLAGSVSICSNVHLRVFIQQAPHLHVINRRDGRSNRGARFHGVGATWVEGTAARQQRERGGRTWDARQANLRTSDRRERAQESLSVRMRGVIEDFPGWTAFHHG